MTCDQYDELFAEAGGRCQVCQIPGDNTTSGRLNLDHDKSLGYWAVRGLLCTSCNSLLEGGPSNRPAVEQYIENAWYRRLPYAHLVQAEEPDDGPVMAISEALRLLSLASRRLKRAKERRSPVWREIREEVNELIRTAHRSGARQVDMVKATSRRISREDVYRATRERRVQPDVATLRASVKVNNGQP